MALRLQNWFFTTNQNRPVRGFQKKQNPAVKLTKVRGRRDPTTTTIVLAAVERHTRSTLGLCDSPDRDPGCDGDVLIYADYKSGRDAQTARDDMKAWVRDKWAEAWGPRPQVLLKSELQDPYFALYVGGFKSSTHPRALYAFFEQYGRLHPTKVRASRSDKAFYANYAEYEGAAAALAAARRGELRFKEATLYANEAKNTSFVSALIAEARSSDRFSFSLDDAKSVAKSLDTKDWPPAESNVDQLIKAVPQRFALDRKTKQFHVIDPDVLLACSGAGTRPAAPIAPAPVVAIAWTGALLRREARNGAAQGGSG